jgi:hypothetical protein
MDGGLDVFLLGAGASHGSVDCEPEIPPLGAELYERLCQRPVFRHLMPEGFAADERSFEATLSKLWDEHADRMIPVLNEVAIYFSEFRPGPGNLYVELGRRIRAWANQTGAPHRSTRGCSSRCRSSAPAFPCHYEDAPAWAQ